MEIPSPPENSALPASYHREARRLRLRLLIALVVLGLGAGGCLSCLVTQPMPSARPGAGPCSVDGSALERHVRMLSEGCAPRDWRSPEGLGKAADYIAAALKAAGGRTSEQTFEVRGKTYRNLLATFGPAEGARIVVGAHYDACEALPGADDNASGVAGLLELARLLGAEPPSCRVDLVAYTLEEPPFFRSRFMGSAQHAQALKAEGAAIRGMIALEMIGHFADGAGSQRYPSTLIAPLYPDRGNFIAVVGRFADIGLTRRVKRAMIQAAPLPVVSINGPRWIPGLDFSDHHPYWDAGFPALMVTDTAFYRNGDYHTARDTADRLDYPRMARVVQGVHAAVLALVREPR